jgi:predicted dehydrogenase
MSIPIQWGVIGPGAIARKFAAALATVEGAELAAVASRTQSSADAFGEEFGIERRYVGYDLITADPDIDIVYIATPHPFHAAHAELCIDAGKPVLCEKPFTVNADQAREVISYAREEGVFVMEAMWTRFFPAMSHLRKVLEDGVLGEVRLIQADFGFRGTFDPTGRLFAPNLAGGALLDVGVYPISFASMVMGAPTRVGGVCRKGRTGVDEVAAVTLMNDSGQIASLTTAVTLDTPQEAYVLGTKGHVKIPSPWWQPTALEITAGGSTERHEFPMQCNGFEYQILEAMSCLTQGRTESSVLPLDETLSIVETMDELRAQWGIIYPFEAE